MADLYTEEQSMSSDILADAMVAIANRGIHSLLVIRNGYIVLDAQYYPFDNDSIHAQYSVAKSFVTTLMDIAYERGELDSLDTSMLTFFQDYEVVDPSSTRETITVDHLLSMRSGLFSVVSLLSAHLPTAVQNVLANYL